MGKGGKVTIGYWYSMTLQAGLCRGPVDAYLELRAGDRTAWSGNVTSSQQVYIDAPNLFGGEKKEGGLQGYLYICMGEADQQPNALLELLRGAPQSANRGLLTLVYDGRVTALNPYIKPWSHKVRAIKAGWRVPVWEPDLAGVGYPGLTGMGLNPAHWIYRLCVEVLGWSPDRLDLVRHKAAAQQLFDENLGLSLKFSKSDGVNKAIQILRPLLRHVC